MCPNPPGSTNPATTNNGNNDGLVIGISVVVNVLVLAIASVLVYCFWKRKRYNEDYAQPNIELPEIPHPESCYEEPAINAQPSRNPQQNRELPPVLDVEDIYEEPVEYAQLDNSKRVPIDDNYQALNAHYTKRDRRFNEDVKDNDAPQKLEYVSVI